MFGRDKCYNLTRSYIVYAKVVERRSTERLQKYTKIIKNIQEYIFEILKKK